MPLQKHFGQLDANWLGALVGFIGFQWNTWLAKVMCFNGREHFTNPQKLQGLLWVYGTNNSFLSTVNYFWQLRELPWSFCANLKHNATELDQPFENVAHSTKLKRCCFMSSFVMFVPVVAYQCLNFIINLEPEHGTGYP